MKFNAPTPGQIHYRTQQQLRVVDKMVQVTQRVAATALARVDNGTADPVRTLRACEHLEEAMILSIALRERIRKEAAARMAPKRCGAPRRTRRT